jgi:hypothetical protein
VRLSSAPQNHGLRWRVAEALSERRDRFSRRGRRDPFPIVVLLLLAIGTALVVTLNNQLTTDPQEGSPSQETTAEAVGENDAPGAATDTSNSEQDDAASSVVEPVVGERFQFATKRHINELGGYAFAYPPEWHLTEEGAVSKITSANRDVLVSFGLGPAGSLSSASERFLAILERSYEGFELDSTRSKTYGVNPGFQYKGTAVNQSGLPIRFLAVVMQGRFGNYAIASFTAGDVGTHKYIPVLQEVLRSFRTAE